MFVGEPSVGFSANGMFVAAGSSCGVKDAGGSVARQPLQDEQSRFGKKLSVALRKQSRHKIPLVPLRPPLADRLSSKATSLHQLNIDQHVPVG